VPSKKNMYYIREMSASGLSSPMVCPDGDASYSIEQLNMPFPNTLTTDTIQPNPATMQLPQSAVQSFVNSLQAMGKLHNTPINPGTGLADTTAMAAEDSRLQSQIQAEYCYLEQRYLYSLKKFLALATSGNNNDVALAKGMLDISRSLNLKISCLLAVATTLASTRALSTNALQGQISVSNSSITTTSQQINDQYKFLSRDNAILETQKELIKYSKEKNDQVTNQIALFTIMNAFAIGAIFAIVRS
jgi:hypothetical protein